MSRGDAHEARRNGRRVTKELAKAFVPGDLARVIELALDVAFFRTQPEGRELGAAAYVELLDRVAHLPEAGEAASFHLGLTPRRRRWFR